MFTRRQFLASLGPADAQAVVHERASARFCPGWRRTQFGYLPPLPVDVAEIDVSSGGTSDLHNHFVFDTTRGTARIPGDTGRVPDARPDIAMPFQTLGPTIQGIHGVEQHARWITETAQAPSMSGGAGTATRIGWCPS
jgi:hypothetical protein